MLVKGGPEIKAKISETSETQVGSNLDIDQMLDDINSILYKAGDINISKGGKTKKRWKQSRKEWFDEDLSKLKHELISLAKAVANDYSNMYLRGKFFSLKKSFKKACIRKRNTFRQTILDNLERLENKNPKEYWELFNQLKSKSANINCGDNIPEDRWIEHYSNLLGPKEYDPTKLAQIEERIQNLKNEPYFSELDFSVSDSEITLAIRSLKKTKPLASTTSAGRWL